MAVHLNQGMFVLLAKAFGLTLGYANGVGQLLGKDQLVYGSGVTSAAYILMELLTAVAYQVSRRASWGRIALRAAGSWILAIGLMYGGFLLFAPGTSVAVSN